jgi:glucosamine--fructose-6-phosphate aminotransferase (isomerizing)
MCGICAYIGYNESFEYLMFGLKMLQNRGYDSAGICAIDNNNNYVIQKYASLPGDTNAMGITAVEILDKKGDLFKNCTIGCVHSRWSTHGAKTDENAHPHQCYQGKFNLVHNGIIENYAIIKKKLIEKHGVTFKSQTDTEVIVNLISVMYNKLQDTELAISSALEQLEGTWGLVIMDIDNPDKLYCARHGSPLLIGFGDDYAMVASEQSGFCKYVNNYICLNDHDIVVLRKHNNKIEFHKNKEYEIRYVTIDPGFLTPEPFEHWTIKEIHEQYDSSMRAMGMGGRIMNDNQVKLGGLASHITELIDVNNLIIIGCGTSFHAGLHCISLFKQISGFNTVSIYDGAEFTKYDIPTIGKTALLILSQSGETRDLYSAIGVAKDLNLYMIGVVNVVDSLIAREVNCGIYLNAGKEVGVASTKAFTSQVIVLNMVAIWFAQIRNINIYKRRIIIESLRRLPIDIKNTVETINDVCKEVATYLKDQHSVFILGKDICESVAKEGALKIKEIGYIHAEGYSSSALKHGPYSLINPGTPIILVNPDDCFYNKNNNIIEEVKSREAFVINITDKILDTSIDVKTDITIRIPKNSPFRGLLSAISMQIIAYQLACVKGHNPDLPKNLAKCITVE